MGAETTDCDSPISLINATFKWIDENLKDEIDFIIWTGDSARHDNDEEIPRTDQQVVQLNELLVSKFVEVFGKEDNINDTDPTNDLTIPIIPTFGNNDILPHNILGPGPNRWTKQYLRIWRKFIPEEQRHGFSRGGWFFVEVIPKKLAVFSLNTLYFFDSNTAVDGCAKPLEPGYEQMEWLRIQLQFLRDRRMKAIMTGHVPPARTGSKSSWDETCWQKYSLWMRQYRDVIVGGLYGHMNIDHFMLQDFKDINIKVMEGESGALSRTAFNEEFTTQSSAEYLTELREEWADLPDPPKEENIGKGVQSIDDIIEQYKKHSKKSKKKGKKGKKHKKSKQEKFLDKIGGPWAERYSATLVGPSVVPNYFPTLRVFEYNITGLEPSTSSALDLTPVHTRPGVFDVDSESRMNTRKKTKGPKHPAPLPPSEASPPGPAYSPQSLTWLSYTQYYANLTFINNDFVSHSNSPKFNPAASMTPQDTKSSLGDDDGLSEERWHEGKHSGKKPHKDKSPRQHQKFEYVIEYDTRTDTLYKLKDLTVRSWFHLADRIGAHKAEGTGTRNLRVDITEKGEVGLDNTGERDNGGLEVMKKKSKKNKSHKKHHGKKGNKVWMAFVRRAFVGSRDEDDLREEFG